MEIRSCKVCKRTFPNGRSLGGHMRSHVMLKSSFNPEEISEGRYGLREKPKKSRWFGYEEVEQEKKESSSTGIEDDQEEEINIETVCELLRNRPGRRSKLLEAISASSFPSSPEYGALCLMMLSRGAGPVLDEIEVKRSESDILRIGIKKVDSFPCESGLLLKDDDVEFKKEVNCAVVLKSEKKRKSPEINFDTENVNLSKRRKYECTICNKSFHSYQALGGHCASHKKIRADSSSVSLAEHFDSQKFRSYECSICEKVFPTGQALGGHKRSHLIAGNSAASASATSTEVIEIEQKNSKQNSLDLNLPASDFEICDSFDSNRCVGEDNFTAFEGSCSVAAHSLKQSAEMKTCFS